MLKLSGCDKQGSVLLANDAVYRRISPDAAESVLEVKTRLEKSPIDGIVETTIVDDHETLKQLSVPPEELLLKHRRIPFISYPHEWCGLMLQDASLFHLSLSVELLNIGLYLKDAHPWNILFSRGRPIFVDYTSMVSEKALSQEDYLEANGSAFNRSHDKWLADVHWEMFSRMFVPYFLYPLVAYALGVRDPVRKEIERTTLNVSTSALQFRDLLRILPVNRRILGNLHRLIAARRGLGYAKDRLRKEGIGAFIETVRQQILNLPISAGKSAYSSYYDEKGENQDWSPSAAWNAKQKSVYEALNLGRIRTVLDVACNTGWFAILAASMGKHVVAFDIDESCIEELYFKVKKQHLDILPLVMSFTEMASDRLSTHDGRIVLLAAEKRLACDAVLALGIIHHLILGLGLDVNSVMGRLVSFAGKRLVIEYVHLDDDKIIGEPDFFPAMHRDPALVQQYQLDNLCRVIGQMGFDVTMKPSFPGTRVMLVCDRKEGK